MSTEYQIRAKYNSAMSTADELDSIAAAISNLAYSDFEGTLSNLRTAWKGENAERFLQKGNIVKEQIASTVGEIRSAASELRSDARATYEAEMRALEILRKKKKDMLEAVKDVFGGGGGGSR